MKFIATKTAEQFDQQELHRVRERLVSQLTGIINQIVEIERLGSLEIDHRLVFRRLFKRKVGILPIRNVGPPCWRQSDGFPWPGLCAFGLNAPIC